MSFNTGTKIWDTLKEVRNDTGQVVNTKSNVSGQLDYIAPIVDEVACPLPTIVPGMWIGDQATAYCETTIEQQTSFSNFASPEFPAVSNDNKLFYADLSLDGVIYFDPATLTDGSMATLIPIAPTGSRPTGAYYHQPTNRMYVNSFNGGGLTVIDCATKAVLHTIAYGTDGSFSRGNVFYIPLLNEIWALGNSGFLRINATTEAIITGSFSATGAIYATSINNKIYVFNDFSTNDIKVYNSSLVLLHTISNLCQNQFTPSGAYVSRGYYTDIPNNKIYAGESSTTGGITIIDAVSDTLTRCAIANEGYTYVSPSVIAFHPLRNTIYIGGGIFNDPTTSIARLWAFDPIGQDITTTVTPTVNLSISSLIYFPNNNNVYVGSTGEVPESSPNTSQDTDGIILVFN